MSKVSSICLTRVVRIGLLAVATALVIVPTAARAKQRIDRRDSTRLSIKHSWVGVAPPTKASAATAHVAVVPVIVARVERLRLQAAIPLDGPVTLSETSRDLSDPLRGPPSLSS
jgi:hypothetical protein